jgi:hypothetical protein
VRLISKQRGFLLNPYRHGGSTVGQPFSMGGEASATFGGAAIASAAATISAEAGATFDGNPTSGAMSMAGEAGMTMTGAAIARGGAYVLGMADGTTFYASAVSAAVDAADFDGTNDYLTKATMTGQAATKTGILSAWFRLDTGAVGGNLITAADLGSGFEILKVTISTTQINILGNNVSAANGFSVTANLSISTGTWYHLLVSWDCSTGDTHLYVNDGNEEDFSSTVNQNIDFGLVDNWTVMAYEQDPSFGGGNLIDGCVAELYCAPGQYLDFSVAANRRKFIDASLNPVSLGATGSTPTGTAPLIYLHLDDGETASNFAVNRGTGGNLTVTGALGTCASSPSD